MEITKTTTKQGTIIVLLLTILSMFIDWTDDNLRVVRLFGNPDLLPAGIIIGGIMGILNLRGLAWGIDSLLGSHKANAKLVFLSLFRLFVLFAIIIILAVLRLINLLGLLVGITVVFIVLIKEGIKVAGQKPAE